MASNMFDKPDAASCPARRRGGAWMNRFGVRNGQDRRPGALNGRCAGGLIVCMVVWVGLALWAAPARAQEAAPAAPPAGETATFLNRAIQQYENGDYQACVEGLTGLLQLNPQDTTARFFRALAYGQLAVPSERRAQVARSQGRLDEASQHERAAAEQYALMRDDLDQLVRSGLNDATAIVRLIEGVVRTKLATFASGGYRERVEARAKLLAEAQQALEVYLNPPAGSGLPAPTGLNRLRAEYFQAVVAYRRALKPAAQAGGIDETADRALLDQAGDLMAGLVEPASDRYVGRLLAGAPQNEVRAWSSYAHLYLGLIRIRQGNDEVFTLGGQPRERFTEARGHFEQAWHLDTGESYPSGQDRSLGRGLIPQIAEKHIPEIDEALKATEGGLTEDIYVQLESGFAYDRNVILLGDDTAVPPSIGRKDDVRFGSAAALGYTLDLGKVSPELDRLSLGLLGRAASNWHGDIDSYNEQNYGASVALQYRLVDPWNANGTRNGPFYLSLQYDYDYYLLGNDGYLKINRLSPLFTAYLCDQRSATSFGFRYEDRNYLEPLDSNVFDRDGNYFAFTLAQSFDAVDMTKVYRDLNWEPWGLPYDPTDPAAYDPSDPTQDPKDYVRWLRPYIGFEYGWDETRGSEFDANRYMLVAGVTVPLPYGVDFDFAGQWEWQDYYHSGSRIDFRRRGREDFVQRYGFGFERRFVLVPGHRTNRRTLKIDRLMMILRADVQFTDNDSNIEDRLGQEVFSYKRPVYGINVAFQFN